MKMAEFHQQSLFDDGYRHYPQTPGFAKDRPTSRVAAEKVKRLTRMQMIVVEALTVRPMTDYEICDHVGLPMNRIQPRRSELSAAGQVIDTGDTRETPYGKQAVVWDLKPSYNKPAG